MAKISDISIPMNGTYKIRVVDRKTKQEYTIRFDIVKDAVRGRGPPALNIGYEVKPYRKKEPKPLIGLYERKKRLSVGIEKLT